MDAINEVLANKKYLESLEEARNKIVSKSLPISSPPVQIVEVSKKNTPSDTGSNNSSMGLVLNELIARIKNVEDSVDRLQGNVKSAIQEKTNYNFVIKRDKDGKIESVTASSKGK